MTDQPAIIKPAIIKQSVRNEYNRIVRHINSAMPLCYNLPNTDHTGRQQMDTNDMPDEGYIYMHWLTTAEVVARTGYNSGQSVINAIKSGKLRGVKLGTKQRGEWRIDPASLEGFKRDPSGRKPK